MLTIFGRRDGYSLDSVNFVPVAALAENRAPEAVLNYKAPRWINDASLSETHSRDLTHCVYSDDEDNQHKCSLVVGMMLNIKTGGYYNADVTNDFLAKTGDPFDTSHKYMIRGRQSFGKAAWPGFFYSKGTLVLEYSKHEDNKSKLKSTKLDDALSNSDAVFVPDLYFELAELNYDAQWAIGGPHCDHFDHYKAFSTNNYFLICDGYRFSNSQHVDVVFYQLGNENEWNIGALVMT